MSLQENSSTNGKRSKAPKGMRQCCNCFQFVKKLDVIGSLYPLCSLSCYSEFYNKRNNFIGSEPKNYVVCKICGLKSKDLKSHVNRIHDLQPKQYIEKYGGNLLCEYTLSIYSERISGNKNPGYKHNGKLSPFSKNGSNFNPIAIEKARINRNRPESKTTALSYYKSKGYSVEESEKLLKSRQSTFTKEKCISKHGTTKGLEIWKLRQDDWQKTLNSKSQEEKNRIARAKISFGSISKAEKEIFLKLSESFPNLISQHILHDDFGKKLFVYDICNDKKIIEYNGDYWHANPKIYNEESICYKKTAKQIWTRDLIKLQFAKDKGYEILVIWESDYKKDKLLEIEKCINFLKQ